MSHQKDDWLVQHIPCETCGSSDARAIKTNGWSKCFSCNDEKTVGPATLAEVSSQDYARSKAKAPAPGILTDLTYQAITSRGLREDTCRKYGYGVTTYRGEPVQVAPYFKDGVVVAQKIRTRAKQFSITGDGKNLPLFGQNTCSGRGKMIVITEGEIDCLTVSQVQDNKWPVVSLPQGASSARKALSQALEFLGGYDRIVLMFDQDDPGRAAVQDAAEVLPPGKAFVATLPLKDANACLLDGQEQAIIRAIWDAAPWRPDAILEGRDLFERLLAYKGPEGAPWPFEGLNAMLPVLPRPGIVTIVAGTGSGKSTLCRALEHHLIHAGENLGLMHLEEDVVRTSLGVVGYELGRRLDVSMGDVKPDELEVAFRRVMRSGVYLYDHFGSTDVDNLVSKVRYFARAGGCRYVVLDHLSIVVSGLDVADERKAIDLAMTRLRTLVQETGIGLILVVHLRRRDGKAAENGGEISLSDIRGSQAVAQLSDVVIALERDQQAEGQDRNFSTLRVLKNRTTGMTGPACRLFFDPETGRYLEYSITQEQAPVVDEFRSGSSTESMEEEIPF